MCHSDDLGLTLCDFGKGLNRYCTELMADVIVWRSQSMCSGKNCWIIWEGRGGEGGVGGGERGRIGGGGCGEGRWISRRGKVYETFFSVSVCRFVVFAYLSVQSVCPCSPPPPLLPLSELFFFSSSSSLSFAFLLHLLLVLLSCCCCCSSSSSSFFFFFCFYFFFFFHFFLLLLRLVQRANRRKKLMSEWPSVGALPLLTVG